MKALKNNQGFSLVELMVVVAIIGILSSIAIPSINKYMAKARQSEAKSNLASIYTANKAFFAEYNVYDTRFNVIGYRPEGQLRYNIGWATPATTNLATYGYSVPPAQIAADSSSRVFCQTNAMCTTLQGAAPTITGSAINAAARTFTAGAGGQVGAGNTEDRWTINEIKTLQNLQDGTN